MIAALVLALQLAAGPDILVVKADSESVIPLVRRADGLALRLDLLAPAIGGSVRTLSDGRTTLVVAQRELSLHEGVPFVRLGTELIPLAGTPALHDGRLLVPLQLVAEVIPRLASGLMYDAARGELRALQTVARARPPTASPPAAMPSRPGATATTGGARPARRRRVVVDAGHGGVDGGMSGVLETGKRVHEKDITLAVARQVQRALEARGVEVIMTRTTDTLIALSDRGRIANQQRGDLFISIHVNAANPRWKNATAARGFETYFLAEARTEDARRVEQMENEAVRFETGVHAPSSDPLGFIIRDMAQNEHLRESSDLAATIQNGLARMHPGPDRGVKQAAFRVLVTAYMPAVLVELGFGTNPNEASFMASAARQKQLAEAIAGATMEYYEHYERRVTQTAP